MQTSALGKFIRTIKTGEETATIRRRRREKHHFPSEGAPYTCLTRTDIYVLLHVIIILPPSTCVQQRLVPCYTTSLHVLGCSELVFMRIEVNHCAVEMV